MKGARQPDQLAVINIGGKDFLVTANEAQKSSKVRTSVDDVALDPGVFSKFTENL